MTARPMSARDALALLFDEMDPNTLVAVKPRRAFAILTALVEAHEARISLEENPNEVAIRWTIDSDQSKFKRVRALERGEEVPRG